MTTITLRHLDNREFARGCHFTQILSSTAWTIDAVMFEFECDEDAISFQENEDGELICVHGEPVAQAFVSYGRF